MNIAVFCPAPNHPQDTYLDVSDVNTPDSFLARDFEPTEVDLDTRTTFGSGTELKDDLLT